MKKYLITKHFNFRPYVKSSHLCKFPNSPPLWSPNEQLTEESALLILIVSDGVIEFMAHSNLHKEKKINNQTTSNEDLTTISPEKENREEKENLQITQWDPQVWYMLKGHSF